MAYLFFAFLCCPCCSCCCSYHRTHFRLIFHILHFDQSHTSTFISSTNYFRWAYFGICRVNFKYMEIASLDMRSDAIMFFLSLVSLYQSKKYHFVCVICLFVFYSLRWIYHSNNIHAEKRKITTFNIWIKLRRQFDVKITSIWNDLLKFYSQQIYVRNRMVNSKQQLHLHGSNETAKIETKENSLWINLSCCQFDRNI